MSIIDVEPALKITELAPGEFHRHSILGCLTEAQIEEAAISRLLNDFLQSLNPVIQVKGEMSGAAWSSIKAARETFSRQILRRVEHMRMLASDSAQGADNKIASPAAPVWINPYNFGFITPEWVRGLSERILSLVEADDNVFTEFHDLARAQTLESIGQRLHNDLGRIIAYREGVLDHFGNAITPDRPYDWCYAASELLFSTLRESEFGRMRLDKETCVESERIIAAELFTGLGGLEFLHQPETKNREDRLRRAPWKMPVSVARSVVEALVNRADSEDALAEVFREGFDLPDDVESDVVLEELVGDILEVGRDPDLANEPISGTPMSFVYQNYRGEVGTRSAIPVRVYYGATKWHPERQWLLEALDTQKGEMRAFALKDILKIN